MLVPVYLTPCLPWRCMHAAGIRRGQTMMMVQARTQGRHGHVVTGSVARRELGTVLNLTGREVQAGKEA